jgi:hypothetical protein
MWGFWWIFPLVGVFVWLAFLGMMFRLMSTGQGFMCIGRHRGTGNDESAKMRREINALHEEIEQLRASR